MVVVDNKWGKAATFNAVRVVGKIYLCVAKSVNNTQIYRK